MNRFLSVVGVVCVCGAIGAMAQSDAKKPASSEPMKAEAYKTKAVDTLPARGKERQYGFHEPEATDFNDHDGYVSHL